MVVGAGGGAETGPPPPELEELEPDAPPPTYTYCTGWLVGWSCTTTRRVILRTTITRRGFGAPSAEAVAGFGETPKAAHGARNASAPAAQAHARSVRLERLGRFGLASVILELALGYGLR